MKDLFIHSKNNPFILLWTSLKELFYIIQTDNVQELTYTMKTNRIDPVDVLLDQLNNKHQLIRPITLNIIVKLKEVTEITK